MNILKTLTTILSAMAIVCSSAQAASVGLNAAVTGLRILSGEPVFYAEADVDGNRKVEMKDVILALQITAQRCSPQKRAQKILQCPSVWSRFSFDSDSGEMFFL